VRVPNHHHALLLRVTDPLVIDDVEVSTLTGEGTVENFEGDILSLDFADDIEVEDGADDEADGKGFDDNLNDALEFNNW